MRTKFVACAALVSACGLAAAQPTIWQFESDLSAASGPGVMTARPAQTFAIGSASSFGLPLINGSDANVMRSDAWVSADSGFNVAHGTGPNGGGGYGNQYTMIWDILLPAIEWHSMYNTNELNINDGEFFVNPAGAIGISGNYSGSLSANTWHRVAMTVDLSTATMKKFIDGVNVGTQTIGGVDGRWALYTTAQTPTDFFILFGDESGEQLLCYVNSYLFEDRVWSEGEIASIGGPTAAGIAPPAGSVPPSASASVSPCNPAGTTAYLTGMPISGQNPSSTSYTLTADLSSIGLASNTPMFDDGTNGDGTPNDGIYTCSFTIPALAPATYPLGVTVTDNLNRSGSGSTGLIVFSDPAGSGSNATQVDFNTNPSPDPVIGSTFGPGVLEFWDAALPGGTQSLAQFGTTTSFGIPNINGEEAGVMFLPALFSGEGLRFNNLSPGNGGGVWVNAYTLAYDLYIPSAQSATPVRIPFVETNNENANGGDFWGRFDDFSLGYQGDGTEAAAWSTPGAFQYDRWHRIVITSDTSLCVARGTIYVDGVPVFNGPIPDTNDNKYALYSTTDGDPEPDREAYAFILSDNGARTADLYINSFYFVDRVLARSEITALGGASASGFFPPPTGCDPDINCDGSPDQGDVACMILAVAGDTSCICQDPDFNLDGSADQGDVAAIIGVVAGQPCP